MRRAIFRILDRQFVKFAIFKNRFHHTATLDVKLRFPDVIIKTKLQTISQKRAQFADSQPDKMVLTRHGCKTS